MLELNGRTIGKIRVDSDEDSSYIYGFRQEAVMNYYEVKKGH
ncbi:hypothetical protein [Clostridium thermarum]|nr:hypothetical protein [Clostridium thermarum]